MTLLAIDIGSSSVKAAILAGTRVVRSTRVPFPTRYTDADQSPRADVDLVAIDRALRKSIAGLGRGVKRVDAIVAATMSPSWLAMDADGRALTAVVTHQDRRAILEAAEIERRVGRERHLALAGNRPFPGGISSTTCAWHLRHAKPAMRRARLVGHLGTWLARAFADVRVIDRSHAGFTGLIDIRTGDWSDELLAAIGLARSLLPRIVDSDAIVGSITSRAARRFGLAAGTPLLAGCIDGSAAMLAAGAKVGQLVNVCGSTDVLALCTNRPHPRDDLLTRPLGIDGKWLSVATIAAAGSAIAWVGETFFRDLDREDYFRHVRRLAGRATTRENRVQFTPTLAGSRTSMDDLRGLLDGLTLGTTRDDVLDALLNWLRKTSADRLKVLALLGVAIRSDVFSTGGGSELAAHVLRASWPKRFRFRDASEATLRGLAVLGERASCTR